MPYLKLFSGIGFTMALAVATVWVLYKNSYQPVERTAEFQRTFFPEVLSEPNEIENQNGWKEICGTTEYGIFLSGKTPDKITFISNSLNAEKTIPLHLTKELIDSIKNIFHLDVDTPFIHLFCGNLSTVIAYSMPTGSLSRYKLDHTYTRGIAISDSAYILRMLDLKLKDQFFVRYQAGNGPYKWEQNITEYQGDGGISNSGILYKDLALDPVVFIPYYKSWFLIMKPDLTGFKYINTIEDVKNPVPVMSVRKDNRSVLEISKPVQIIHGPACMDKNYLYITSRVRSREEAPGSLEDHVAVDIYHLSDGGYTGSFYIPLSSKALRSLRVKDDRLFVLTRSGLIKYRLHRSSFNSH